MRGLKIFRLFFFAVLPVCILSIGLFGCTKNGTSSQQSSGARISYDGTFVIPWQISQPPEIPGILETIEETLQDPRGWSQADLIFKRSNIQSQKESSVIFGFFSYRTGKNWNKCSKGSTWFFACVRGLKGKYWEKPNGQMSNILKREGPCVIWLNEEIFNSKGPDFGERILTINHEAGHCLGLHHDHVERTIVTHASTGGNSHPTSQDIKAIKQFMVK